jgi:alpha-L-fucosidase 2
MANGGGSYANLLCAHPPFQLDGNMGSTAGVAEMLLQSQTGVIELLPALPDAWPAGAIKGLKARGNVTVDEIWENGRLKSVTLSSTIAQKRTVKYGDKTINVDIASGKPKTLKTQDFQ